MGKRTANGDQLAKLRQGGTNETGNNVELTKNRVPERLQLNVEKSTPFQPEVPGISAEKLLSSADQLGVKVDYNFKFANENDRAGGEHRRRELAEKAEYLILLDQGARLHKAFVKIRNYGMREAAINFMVLLTEVGNMR